MSSTVLGTNSRYSKASNWYSLKFPPSLSLGSGSTQVDCTREPIEKVVILLAVGTIEADGAADVVGVAVGLVEGLRLGPAEGTDEGSFDGDSLG